MNKNPDRIPYETWTNSQLSIARHFGGCKFGGEHYFLDYDSCTPTIKDGEELWKPDLVRENSVIGISKIIKTGEVGDILVSDENCLGEWVKPLGELNK